MTDLHRHLSRLGLLQYVDQFIDEGFESWETVLHITESDLDHLKVKLGHRRILQAEIALEREGSRSPSRVPGHDGGRSERPADSAHRGKRKYRRHPKQDENAPERPPSAYVLFSNRVREELKPLNLSFTEIAKRVGERWQALSMEEKSPFESQASAAKEKYHQELSAYKTTDEYRGYMGYLADFKAKNANAAEGKKPRLETEDTTSSVESALGTGHRRYDSHPTGGGLPSPVHVPAGGMRVPDAVAVPPAQPSPVPGSLPSSPGIGRESSTSSVRSGLLARSTGDVSAVSPGLPLAVSRGRDRSYSRRSSNASSSIDRRQDTPGVPRPRVATPTLVHQNTSSSSGYSSGSGLSNPSTGSSLFTLRNIEDEARPQLPPLASVRPSGPPSLAEYSLRNSQTPETITPPSVPPPLAPSSQYSPTSSTISIDAPPRTSFRNLTIQQGPGGPSNPNDVRLPSPSLAQLRDPPHQAGGSTPKTLPPPTHLPSIRTAPPPSILGGDNAAAYGSTTHSSVAGRDRLSLLAEVVAQSDPDPRVRPPS